MSTETERQAVLDIVSGIERPVVVELGAYDGEDMIWVREACPGVRYYMVEADPRNAAMVREFRDMEGIIFIEAAIADHTGHCELNLCDNECNRARASSSIRRPKEHLDYFPWCTFDETITVPCLSLDDLFHIFGITRADLLWADLQGAERDMIKGGAEALKRTRYLFTEADENEMYEGQATRWDLLRSLPDWEMVATFDYNVLLKNTKCD